jgi:hypothetical protein
VGRRFEGRAGLSGGRLEAQSPHWGVGASRGERGDPLGRKPEGQFPGGACTREPRAGLKGGEARAPVTPPVQDCRQRPRLTWAHWYMS